MHSVATPPRSLWLAPLPACSPPPPASLPRSGHIHVLKAATGEAVPPFPFRVFGKVMAPPLLTKLDNPKDPGLQIVVTAFDGFLYVIDGITGEQGVCVCVCVCVCVQHVMCGLRHLETAASAFCAWVCRCVARVLAASLWRAWPAPPHTCRLRRQPGHWGDQLQHGAGR